MSAVEEAQARVDLARMRYQDAVNSLRTAEKKHPYSGTPAIFEARRRKEAAWQEYRAALTDLRDAEGVEQR
jgi:hypothetical protein